MKLKEDLIFGEEKENSNLDVFRNFLNCPELQKTRKNAVFDYESEKYLVELKTRRCLSTTYKDTMFGLNKLNFCKDKGKETYFCFQFNDGLFYWKYCLEDEPKLRLGRGGRFDRSRIEVNDYVYVPLELLTKI